MTQQSSQRYRIALNGKRRHGIARTSSAEDAGDEVKSIYYEFKGQDLVFGWNDN
ncbi:MAG: hypothetical protein IKP43_12075 [Bacteroidaceae bacterium]|nr:hypothetical protein [Bacteroidaceae bacterium]